MKNLCKKLDNSGAALVLVIVVISFVSIIATLLLYMSSMNFFMKTTDVKIKKSFYDGEQAIEEVRAAFMEYASDASRDAYDDIIVSYAKYADVQDEFNKEFLSNFKDIFDANTSSSEAVVKKRIEQTLLSNVVSSKFSGSISLVGPDDIPYEYREDEGKFILKGVQVDYTDPNGFVTIVSTDIIVTAPTVNFAFSGSEGGNTSRIIPCVTYRNWTKK